MFAILKLDPKVATAEKFRIDARKSFLLPGETLDEIKISVDGAENILDQTDPGSWYLDWAFEDVGVKPILLTMTSGATVKTASANITCTDSEIFLCKEEDMSQLEPEISGYLPEDRSNYNFVLRSVSEKVENLFVQKGFKKPDGSYFVIADILKSVEFFHFAKYLALSIAYYGISNIPEDHFAAKGKYYFNLAEEQKGVAFNTLNVAAEGDEENSFSKDNKYTILRRS